MNNSNSKKYNFFGIMPALFLFLVIIYPLVNLLFLAFSSSANELLGYPQKSIFDSFNNYYLMRVLATVLQAGLAAIICASIALPLSLALWVLEQSPDKYLQCIVKLIEKILLLPFILPVIVVVIAFSGLSDNFFDSGIIPLLCVYVFYNLGLMVWLCINALRRISPNIINSARTLGANNLQIILKILIPTIKNSIWSGMALVFLFCASSFGVAFMLGGECWATIEVEIYLQTTQSLNLSLASFLALIQLIMMMIICWFFSSQNRQIQLSMVSEHEKIYIDVNKKESLSLLLFCLCTTTIVISPIIGLVYHLFNIRFSVFLILINNPDFIKAIINTIKFPLMALPIAFTLALLSAIFANFYEIFSREKVKSKIHKINLQMIFYLPYMISTTVLALGLLITYTKFVGNLLILVFAYSLLAYPLLARSIYLGLQQHNRNLFLAVINLGGNYYQGFRQGILPQILPQMRSGLAFAAATMLGEFSATLFLARPQWMTLSTFIYQYLGKVGETNIEQAKIASAILILLALMVYTIISGWKKIFLPNKLKTHKYKNAKINI